MHYHIFKNAGTTIEWVLANNFRRQFARLDGKDRFFIITQYELLELLKTRPDIRAISTHTLFPPKPNIEGLHIHDLVLVRHPLDRLMSMYDFYHRANDKSDPLGEAARKLEPERFFAFLIQKYPHLITAVAAISPAIWTSYAQARDANAGAYASAAAFAANDAVTHAPALARVPVRVAAGHNDPFYPGVRALARASSTCRGSSGSGARIRGPSPSARDRAGRRSGAERPPLDVQPRELREESRVNVEDPAAPARDEVRREQAHVSGQADQIRPRRVQRRNDA